MPDLRTDGDLADGSASAGTASFCSSRVCSACDVCATGFGPCPSGTGHAVESAGSRSRRTGVLRATCTCCRTGVCAPCIRAPCFFAAGDGDEFASSHARHAVHGQPAVPGPRADTFPGATSRSGAFPGADFQHRLPFGSRWPAAEAQSRPATDEHGPTGRRHARTGLECRTDGSQPGPFAASPQLWAHITSRRANARSSSWECARRSARDLLASDSGGSFAANAARRWHRCRPDARYDRPARRRIAAGT
jgi:hypothetical protein